jgi:WD40 repeat protein
VLVNEANLVSLISFDPATRKLSVSKSVGISNDINDVEWARDSSRIVLGHHSGFVEVYSVPALAKESAIAAHGSTIFAMQLDPKGKLLATGGADAVVHLWNATELVCIRSFPRLEDSIRALSFSSDSSLLAYGGKDPRLEIADVDTGARVHLIELTDECLAIAFHPSLPVLAYSTAEKGRVLGDVNLISCVQPPLSHGASASSSNRSGGGAASSSSSATKPSAATTAAATAPATPSKPATGAAAAAAGGHQGRNATANAAARAPGRNASVADRDAMKD